MACHHGNGPTGTKGSEYTTWIAQNDPHSRAYTVLFDRRSLLIARNLNRIEPHKDVLCLRCHVNPDVETASHHERFARADGVGCESCHGAAEKWLSVHYTPPWRSLSAEEKRRMGMIDTKDVAVRARVCVRCHVGWEQADVNHDLIAAGHPRLRFEYGAYLANYPARHWNVSDDHARYGDFEARAWLVGQTASAKAALELLAYRADEAHGQPWPEFAEYGCFSCHHSLRDQGWRRKRNAEQLPWGTWYFAERDMMAGAVGAGRITDSKVFDELGRLMATIDPKQRANVTIAAGQAARTLDRWLNELAKRDAQDEKSLAKLLAALTKETANPETDWDRAAQRYLGIAAIYNALGDRNKAYFRDTELKNNLHRIADLLSDALPKERGVRYDSPRDFSPDLLQQELMSLRRQLRRRGVE